MLASSLISSGNSLSRLQAMPPTTGPPSCRRHPDPHPRCASCLNLTQSTLGEVTLGEVTQGRKRPALGYPPNCLATNNNDNRSMDDHSSKTESEPDQDGQLSQGRNKKRRRRPFSPKRRAATARTRVVGACAECRRRKVRCHHSMHASTFSLVHCDLALTDVSEAPLPPQTINNDPEIELGSDIPIPRHRQQHLTNLRDFTDIIDRSQSDVMMPNTNIVVDYLGDMPFCVESSMAMHDVISRDGGQFSVAATSTSGFDTSGNGQDQLTTNGLHKCLVPSCPQIYLTADSLVTHMRRVHPNLRDGPDLEVHRRMIRRMDNTSATNRLEVPGTPMVPPTDDKTLLTETDFRNTLTPLRRTPPGRARTSTQATSRGRNRSTSSGPSQRGPWMHDTSQSDTPTYSSPSDGAEVEAPFVFDGMRILNHRHHLNKSVPFETAGSSTEFQQHSDFMGQGRQSRSSTAAPVIAFDATASVGEWGRQDLGQMQATNGSSAFDTADRMGLSGQSLSSERPSSGWSSRRPPQPPMIQTTSNHWGGWYQSHSADAVPLTHQNLFLTNSPLGYPPPTGPSPTSSSSFQHHPEIVLNGQPISSPPTYESRLDINSFTAFLSPDAGQGIYQDQDADPSSYPSNHSNLFSHRPRTDWDYDSISSAGGGGANDNDSSKSLRLVSPTSSYHNNADSPINNTSAYAAIGTLRDASSASFMLHNGSDSGDRDVGGGYTFASMSRAAGGSGGRVDVGRFDSVDDDLDEDVNGEQRGRSRGRLDDEVSQTRGLGEEFGNLKFERDLSEFSDGAYDSW